MAAKTYHAPAKVNLNLRVLGKREDGFHELETLMYPVQGLVDDLTFEPASSLSLECDEPGVPLDESNLVMKAVHAFERKTGIDCRYRITLQKRIPHGAGLGGGSSDAATALLALNALENAGLSRDQLSDLAAEFGSDTSFFVYESPAWCRGRGVDVEPCEIQLDGAIVLLKPQFSIPTPETFKAWADSRELEGVDYAPQNFSWGEMVNDLERPVFQKYLHLASLKGWMLQQNGVKGAMMSGSGSTMFALVESVEAGEGLLRRALADVDQSLWGGVYPF